jgi:hypothetical protein
MFVKTLSLRRWRVQCGGSAVLSKTCQRLADFVHRVFHSKGGNVHKIVTSSMVEAFLNRDDCSYPHQMKSEKLEMI